MTIRPGKGFAFAAWVRWRKWFRNDPLCGWQCAACQSGWAEFNP